jgi:transposase
MYWWSKVRRARELGVCPNGSAVLHAFFLMQSSSQLQLFNPLLRRALPSDMGSWMTIIDWRSWRCHMGHVVAFLGIWREVNVPLQKAQTRHVLTPESWIRRPTDPCPANVQHGRGLPLRVCTAFPKAFSNHVGLSVWEHVLFVSRLEAVAPSRNPQTTPPNI